MRNRLAGTKTGKSRSARYYQSNPKAKAKKLAYDKNYQKSSDQVSNRVKRNQARKQAISKGVAKVGDGKDIDHKTPLKNGGSNVWRNLRVMSRNKNRGRK